MRKITAVGISIFALSMSFTSLLAHADSDDDGGHHSRFAVSIGPTWYHLTQNNYLPAFTSNGFNTPSSDRFDLSFLAYWTTASDWQLGLAAGGFSTNQDIGTYEANYQSSNFGFYFAKNLTPDTDFDVTLGSLLGVEMSQVEVFSALRNGKFIENAALFQPMVGSAYRVSKMVKLGLIASYLVPFAQSTTLHGQDLGVNNISAQGFSLTAQVIFGRFDLSKK